MTANEAANCEIIVEDMLQCERERSTMCDIADMDSHLSKPGSHEKNHHFQDCSNIVDLNAASGEKNESLPLSGNKVSDSGCRNAMEVNFSNYQQLPKEFFPYSHVPPPLVNISWLKFVYKKLRLKKRNNKFRTKILNEGGEEIRLSDENDCSVDDSLPLATLKVKLQNVKDKNDINDEKVNDIKPVGNSTINFRPKRNTSRGKTKNFEYVDSITELSLDDDSIESIITIAKAKIDKKTKVAKVQNIPLVNRKRGRPKKSNLAVNSATEDSDSSFWFKEDITGHKSPDEDVIDDNWWNDDNNETSSDIPVEMKLEVEEAPNNIVQNNCQEHDYFKPVSKKCEIAGTDTDEAAEGNVKKKKKNKGGTSVSQLSGIKAGKSKLIFPCSECGKSFSAASTLKYHLRIHNGTLIRCTECDKGFTTNYLLKCHMRLHNGDLFMCHKCGRGFTTAELLKVHGRGHTGDRPFTCHVCGKAFSSASNLAQHKETHDPEKKYLCFQCGSSFSQKRCLDGHMLSHGEKNHICNVCGKLWARKSDLTEHMRVHTGSKPYSCNMCPQRFTQASSLKRHQIVHMETKPIPCLNCGKLFKCEEYYKRHVRKHEKESELTLNNDKDE